MAAQIESKDSLEGSRNAFAISLISFGLVTNTSSLQSIQLDIRFSLSCFFSAADLLRKGPLS